MSEVVNFNQISTTEETVYHFVTVTTPDLHSSSVHDDDIKQEIVDTPVIITIPAPQKPRIPQFSVQVLAEVVKYYFETGSPLEARAKFKAQHNIDNEKDCPSVKTIRRCAKQFLKTGSVGKRPKTRTSTKRTHENTERVEALLEDNPKISIRTLSKQLGVGRETCRRMVQDVKKKKRAEAFRKKQEKKSTTTNTIILTEVVETMNLSDLPGQIVEVHHEGIMDDGQTTLIEIKPHSVMHEEANI